jgi:diacylglycerol kinase (ATP)
LICFVKNALNSPEKPAPATGISRIWKAFFYSISGFRLAFRDESAFRQELLLVIVLSGLCLFLPFEPWIKVILIFSHVIVLIAELLNTAVEAIVDMASPGFHPDAKKAKDTGSSAVLLSLVLSGGLWCYALWTL